MSAAALLVRDARPEDAYPLWIWANDFETRRASYGRSPIEWSDHRAWLMNRLGHPGNLILIVERADECPVGTIRFNTEDNWITARLSYLVAPEARGAGLSVPLVAAGIKRLHAERSSVAIHADVMLENRRSLRVFERLGWRKEGLNHGTVRFWLCT